MKFVKFTSLLLALMLCAAPAFAEEGNTFTIATNAEFAPWEMVGEGGEYVGIDMDLARLIAEELGMELVIENVDFNSVVNMVVTGKADAAIAGLTITPEREEEVLFSIPYATAVQSVIVREGYEEIATLDDLVGKIVGVQMSTTGDLFVSEMEGVEVRQYSSGTNAAMDLAAGRVDAVMIDSAPAASIVSNIEGLVILEGIEMDEESYSIAFAKDNTELCEQVNAILEKLIEDGTVEELYLKYTLGDGTEEEAAAEETAEEATDAADDAAAEETTEESTEE
ncbi:MAG TPA: basic amino acid ABC transporter substrate-binding protein [Candidatus Alectryocaccomicrobium excrementavium]|uniref:Basic amino acid ABC transporter substrate-binding protein n=1 Tax=Candidatus Alectryocaccomicrobium excrementavium TaxID=2840668 RepID=A0A9D1G0T5_9FIRM|nr:basic amino acid ABC transporter substrate-binding protein [Candidatus Alectryocaccomicrobium excrementavium]